MTRGVARVGSIALVALIAGLGIGALGDGVELVPSDSEASDRFGAAVAIDGDVVVVGAPGFDVLIAQTSQPIEGSDVGAVFVYRRQGTSAVEEQIVVPDDGQTFELMGTSVAIDGDTFVAGAPQHDFAEAPNFRSGAAHVFVRAGAQWNQQALLRAPDAQDGDECGATVAISGDYAVVGAPSAGSPLGDAEVNRYFRNGEVHVFRRTGSAWSFVQTLIASDTYDDHRFGSSVSIDGTRIVVGAPGEQLVAAKSAVAVGPGAYVFERQGNLFVETCKILSTDYTFGDEFGASVAVQGDDIVVGAPGASIAETDDDGVAYVFRRNGEDWPQQARLTTGQEEAFGNRFGTSVDIDRGVVVVGSPRARVTEFGVTPGFEAGLAEVFRRSGTSWNLTDTLTRSLGDEFDLFGSAVAVDSGSVAVSTPEADGELGPQVGGAVAYFDGGNVPPENTVRSFILPKTVLFTRPRVKLTAFFDTGPDEVDLEAGGTLSIGAVDIEIPSLTPNKSRRKFTYVGQDLKLVIKPSKIGTSKGLMSLTLDRDLGGELSPDGEFAVQYVGGGIAARGVVKLDRGKFKFGRRAGDILEPEMSVRSATANFPGVGRHGFKFVAGFTTDDGTAPATAPDVTIAFGDVFNATVPSSALVRKGETFVFKGDIDGIKQVVIDYAKERVRVTGARVDLGDVELGQQPLLLILSRADDVRAVQVRGLRNGKFLRY